MKTSCYSYSLTTQHSKVVKFSIDTLLTYFYMKIFLNITLAGALLLHCEYFYFCYFIYFW